MDVPLCFRAVTTPISSWPEGVPGSLIRGRWWFTTPSFRSCLAVFHPSYPCGKEGKLFATACFVPEYYA